MIYHHTSTTSVIYCCELLQYKVWNTLCKFMKIFIRYYLCLISRISLHTCHILLNLSWIDTTLEWIMLEWDYSFLQMSKFSISCSTSYSVCSGIFFHTSILTCPNILFYSCSYYLLTYYCNIFLFTVLLHTCYILLNITWIQTTLDWIILQWDYSFLHV